MCDKKQEKHKAVTAVEEERPRNRKMWKRIKFVGNKTWNNAVAYQQQRASRVTTTCSVNDCMKPNNNGMGGLQRK